MQKIAIFLISVLIMTGCQRKEKQPADVITSDVGNFWIAFDRITATTDTLKQYGYLEELYLKQGTAGLQALIENRSYTPKEYLDAINNYPKFWSSVRENTLRFNEFSTDLAEGIKKLSTVYPEIKPAKIYFTIGALRTGGTTMDSLVLIGSEIAMADENTITSEFPEGMKEGRRKYFDSNPINDLVLLNIHEYVHTQQEPMVHNLLSYAIYEGVAEFVSVKALNTVSSTPAIEYGKKNDQVRLKFEEEMFYGNNVSQWLWSDAENNFGVRDLGYYIGYQICELYYNQANDKPAAIKKMIELDYTNDTEIENFIDGTGFFSSSIQALYENFESRRPTVAGIKPFENNSEKVSPEVTEITIVFSEPLNGYNTGIDFGPLGKDFFPPMSRDRIWSEDARSWTVKVDLQPNRQYQFLVSNNFRTQARTPLKPYLIEFRTTDK